MQLSTVSRRAQQAASSLPYAARQLPHTARLQTDKPIRHIAVDQLVYYYVQVAADRQHYLHSFLVM